MRHDIVIEGHAFRLRPVRDADAAFIVALRGDPALGRYLHAGASSEAEQLRWLAGYYERSGDFYFVVERRDTGAPEGLVAVYGIDGIPASGEWGRWILQAGSLAAVESAWLAYRCGFEVLHLMTVFCRTVAANASVVSFHDSCGIAVRRTLVGHFEIDGQMLDAVEHRLGRAEWSDVAKRLDGLARMTARRVARG